MTRSPLTERYGEKCRLSISNTVVVLLLIHFLQRLSRPFRSFSGSSLTKTTPGSTPKARNFHYVSPTGKWNRNAFVRVLLPIPALISESLTAVLLFDTGDFLPKLLGIAPASFHGTSCQFHSSIINSKQHCHGFYQHETRSRRGLERLGTFLEPEFICLPNSKPVYVRDLSLLIQLLYLRCAEAFVLLFTFGWLVMGNEGSAPSSEDSTPISDFPSLYSIHSRVRSSVESTRAPSPMEAPEPDMSHLTPEEIAQIRSVMDRARNMQQEEHQRIRKLEEDYIHFASHVERENLTTEIQEVKSQVCQICNKTEMAVSHDTSGPGIRICVECEKRTCSDCGDYRLSSAKLREWQCAVCEKRRELLMSSGLWYHGAQTGTSLQVDKSKTDLQMTSSMDTSLTSNGSMASSRGSSRESRDDSGFRDVSRDDGYDDGSADGRSFKDIPRCGGESGLAMDISSLTTASIQNSELARQVYEQSRMKGPGATLPKSESDDFSDMTSDLDFDELASERSRPDGGSSTDENSRELMTTSVSKPNEMKVQRRRPKSLKLTRSVSHTSSDEEEGDGERKTGEESGKAHGNDRKDERRKRSPKMPLKESSKVAGKTSTALVSSNSVASQPPAKAASLTSTSVPPGENKRKKEPPSKLFVKDQQSKPQPLSVTHDLADGLIVNSPTPPRSPSWREGLESPPFSPRRRDSYPGKRRGSLSPKDKKSHFTYTDISPPSRQLSLDELYGEGPATGSALDNGVVGSQAPQKPSPMSPDEIKDSIVTTMGDPLVFDMPASRNKSTLTSTASSSSQGPQLHHNDYQPPGPLPHSAPLMDLATYAATIANSTASLTSLSVSPTNLLPHSTHSNSGEPLSPDSIGSADSSSSPVSPGYYDNSTPPSEDSDEVELADPSAKSIDFQGSKRQKARPPSTDWSPVIDLSPILDVSPSVEEAEQQDMLAKQLEEKERQRSRDEEEGDDDYHEDDDEFSPLQSRLNIQASISEKKTAAEVIPKIPPPPSSKKLKQKLHDEENAVNGNVNVEDQADGREGADDKDSFLYNGSLRRCGNFEDISQLDSNFAITKERADNLSSDRTTEDMDIHEMPMDLPFFSCTSQAYTLPHSAPCLSFSGGSAFHAPIKQSGEASGAMKAKDFETLISDEIHKIAEDMENITKRGIMADIKPIPPPKPKRRLPDPESATAGTTIAASVSGASMSSAAISSSSFSSIAQTSSSTSSACPIPSIKTEEIGESNFISHNSPSKEGGVAGAGGVKLLSRQDSIEKKKAKDMKAKPSPILIQHIESEEQSVSPHYRVMESPPTPEVKTIKREFSDSTSVSTTTTPEQEVYTFPSPVTPPDSDSSPPKPHSPSSPGTDIEEDVPSVVRDESTWNPYREPDLSSFRSLSPYDNDKPCFVALSSNMSESPQLCGAPTVRTTMSKSDVSNALAEVHSVSHVEPPQSQNRSIRPPISPRKSLKKMMDKNINGPSSPVYENVTNLTQEAYMEEQKKNLGFVCDMDKDDGGKRDFFTGLSDRYPSHRTDIFTYPLVTEGPTLSQTSATQTPAATSTTAGTTSYPSAAAGTGSVDDQLQTGSVSHQIQTQNQPRCNNSHQHQPPLQQQQLQQQQQQQQQQQNASKVTLPSSATAKGASQDGGTGEAKASVRDKIKVFEEAPVPRRRFTSGPKTSTPSTQEPRRDPRREAFVMKDKRADSNSSSSSSASSRFSTSSDTSKSTDKEPPPAKDGKKVRRKLPPIPVGEQAALGPKTKSRRPKPPPKKEKSVGRNDESTRGCGTRVVEVIDSSGEAEPAYFIGPSNRSNSSSSINIGGRTIGRDSDEDDLEVARITKVRESSSKPSLSETGKSKSFDSSETYHFELDVDTASHRSKPPMQKTASLGYGPKDETDEIIDSLINIYGIPCTEAMKCLKKKLQEELRRVTKDRKRKLEELEEIRALQMQIGALKLDSDAYGRSRSYTGKRSPAQYLHVETQQADSRKRGSAPSPSGSVTSRSSPQVTPRRQRHKRQSSDPMISKFSPIKEDRDIETDFQTRSQSDTRAAKYHTDDSSQSGVSDTESTRSEPVRETRYRKGKKSDYVNILCGQSVGMGGSAERLQYPDYEQKRMERNQALSGSRSEQHLSSTGRSYFSDDNEVTIREEKKALLQYEIMKRKQQLEETTRLKNELLKLARARQSLAHSYDDIPRQYGSSVVPHRPVPKGIIKPIDDENQPIYDRLPPDHVRTRSRSRERSGERSRDRSRERLAERNMNLTPSREDLLHEIVLSEHRSREPRVSPRRRGHRGPPDPEPLMHPQQPHHHHHHHQHHHHDRKGLSNYSSTEYLAHKQESRRHREEPSQYSSQPWVGRPDYDQEDAGPVQAYSQPSLNRRTDSSQSLLARREAAHKEPVISSSVTLPNIYANRADVGFRPPYRDGSYVSTSISDTDGSPASDITPAMPLLDDVKMKSRTIIRNIGSGSRPVSAEFSAGEVEDLLNAMYRVESDNSVDADEPIMKHMTEGGVTILKQMERKRRPAPVEPFRYDFPVKRILVTRDLKDKSITGNGLGMKIVGGKEIPGTGDMGAYVTAIYPGIIADQLHGELDVGDQVLEWNGIHLTGLSARDVQDIVSHTNGEIEMVVRAQTMPINLNTLIAQPESCRSSYDNLPSYVEIVKEPPRQRSSSSRSSSRQGVDPHQLAAQLEGIRESVSPAENSPASFHQDAGSPSVSSPCSTPRSDPTSTSSDRQLRPAPGPANVGGDRTDRHVERHSFEQQQQQHQAGRRRRRNSPNPDRVQHQVESSNPQKNHHQHRHHHHQQQQHQAIQQSIDPEPHHQESHHHHHQHQHEHQHPRQQHQHSTSPSMGGGHSEEALHQLPSHHHQRHQHQPHHPHQQHHHQQQQQPINHQQQQPNHPPVEQSDQSRVTITADSVPERQQPTRKKTERRKPPSLHHQHQKSSQQHPQNQPEHQHQPQAQPHQENSSPLPPVPPERSRPTATFDPSIDDPCSSPAMNDRLRASPPLDTRRSIKYRASKKGKDNFVAPPKPVHVETEKGEDFGLGEVQLQISHDDFDNTLNLHVIQARNLRPRDLNGLSDPFVKLYLLPGRGPENKRRTKQIPRTLNPEWHQTVMFQDVARLELQNKVLEITVWDYDRFKANDFLGELIIELREFAFLDNKPHWYPLKEHVTMHSFELPKSTVAPPKPVVEPTRAKTRSPRHGKKHGVSSLRPQDSKESDSERNPRRRSLGTLTGSGSDEKATQRQVSSATNSPLPGRRQRGTKSPIKTRSNGLLYR